MPDTEEQANGCEPAEKVGNDGSPQENEDPDKHGEDEDEEEQEEQEFSVEKILGKRKNQGEVEYLIKWEGYASDENTWEPIDNLNCPSLINQYEEEEAAKRRAPRQKTTPRMTTYGSSSQTMQTASQRRRARNSMLNGESSSNNIPETTDGTTSSNASRRPTPEITISDSDDSDEEMMPIIRGTKSRGRPRGGVQHTEKNLEAAPVVNQKGFDRGHQLDTIIGSCYDQTDKLYFLVRWKNRGDQVECIPVEDLEESAPRELCAWYRQRIYHSVQMPLEKHVMQLFKQGLDGEDD